MSSKLNRTAAGVFAVLMALAIVDVSNSLAQAAPTADEIISTTCGAGTLEKTIMKLLMYANHSTLGIT